MTSDKGVLNRFLHRMNDSEKLERDKRTLKRAVPNGPIEGLSEVEDKDWFIPPNYRGMYHDMLVSDPEAAKAFWNKWKIRREPTKSPAVVEQERRLKAAGDALSRVVNGNELKRRV